LLRVKRTPLFGRIKNFIRDRIMNVESPMPDNRKIVLGLGFIGIGLLLPNLIKPSISALLNDLQRSIVAADPVMLLLATNKLVFLNTLRHSPIIIGSFLFGEALASKFRLNRLVFFLTLLLIPVLFRLISAIYDIQFLFTRSNFITVLVVLGLYFLTFKIRTVVIKVIIIFLFLSGFDWLEVMPVLGKYGFGGGDVARTIRIVSEYLNADYILNYLGTVFSLMLIINALILTRVVVEYYNKMALVDKLGKIEIEALRSRSFQEVKHLVHDLKTPLVTIQGLNEVIGLKVADPQIKEYTVKISDSVEKVSSMISEILHESSLKPIYVKEILDFLRIHLSLEELHARVIIGSHPDAIILANKHLLARALINVIDNGLQATEAAGGGCVKVSALEEEGNIVFIIRDNGRGIPKDSLYRIWELGYSEEKSTGLGLNFVRKVVNDHHGEIYVTSKVGVGTIVKISLPGGEMDEGQNSGGR